MADVVRFDRFEVDLTLGRLSRGRARVRVREQSFRVLAALLERPGEVVTRDQLRSRLWPETVFVDFENSLNTAVGRLRQALGDSAVQPRFIETLPRRGYRFIGILEPAPTVESRSTPRPRLLVLPFANLGDPAQEYFSDAITDEVITSLANLSPQRLAVIARTTAMHYKGSRKDVARIGREVGAQYIVEGTVRQAAGRVSVNVQLVQAGDQTHLLAKRYGAAVDAVFDLQASIAEDIGARLPPLAGWMRGDRSRRKPTDSPAAYREYVRARHEMWKWTPESVASARKCFEAALTCDPGFALACDGLANLYSYLGFWGFLPPEDAEPLRWFYAARAAELDPTLPEPKTLVAYHPRKTHHDDAYTYDWGETERGMVLARDLDPYSPVIRLRHASVLMVLGDMAQATAELRHALDLDPLSPEVAMWLTWALFLSRDHDGALAQAQNLLERYPTLPFAHMAQGIAYLGLERFRQSIGAFRKAAAMSGEMPVVLGWLGLALGLGGHRDEARTLLERLHRLAKERYVLPTSLAWLYLGLGQVDDAFVWMEQAALHNDEWIHVLKTYPVLDPYRADPRFPPLLAALGLDASGDRSA